MAIRTRERGARVAPPSPVEGARNIWAELQKVTWPTRRQVINLTGIVIAVSIVIGVLLGAIDYAFYYLIQQVILK